MNLKHISLCALATSLFYPGFYSSSARTVRQAGNTPSPVPSTSAQAKQAPTDDASNAALWDRAQRMYAANDFAQASAAASRINSPSLKKGAGTMLNQIQAYAAALQAGAAAEGQKDPIAAIKAYAAAALIKSDGPGNPAARIARIQQQAAASAASEKLAEKDKLALRAQQHRLKATALVHKATAQEASGDLEAALTTYQTAQMLDPTNATASGGVARLAAHLHQSVAAPNASPAAAIRAFYAGQYAAAEQQLSTYVQNQGAPDSGAAFFYLGASRFSMALLESKSSGSASNLPGVRDAFHHARSLGYVPLPQYVSPALLEAWKHAS